MGKRKSAMLVFRIVEILRNNATREKPMKLMQILRRLEADYSETVDRAPLRTISPRSADRSGMISRSSGKKASGRVIMRDSIFRIWN